MKNTDMKNIKLWGYTIYENGIIKGINGKPFIKRKQIKIKWGNNKQYKLVSYARFVYYAFNYKNFNFNDKTIVIKHKDNNDNNFNINNLVAIRLKYLNQGENHPMAKLTNKQIEEIKAIYKQKKEKNLTTNDPYTKISYRKLAEKYGVSHTMIAGVVSGIFRNKDNYKL